MSFAPQAMRNTPIWTEFTNNSGETCPAFGVIKITGSTNGVLQGDKPDGENLKNVRINGPVPVPNGDTGLCTITSQASVLYDTGDTVTNGDDWGTTNGQWYLAKDNLGFKAVGEAANGRAVFDVATAGGIPEPTAAGQVLQAESDGSGGFVWVAKLLELT